MTITPSEAAPTMTWAVTLFSFTNEMHERTRSADGLVRLIADEHLASAVEVDAAQHFRSFPVISTEEITAFRRTLDETGLTPTMLGGYLDLRLDPRGPRTPEEEEEFLLGQVRAAADMGFFAVRMSLGAVGARLRERLLPELERRDIALLAEVQAGARPDAPAIDELRTHRERLGTDRLGFVFDSSLVMQEFPPTWIRALQADGVPDEIISTAEALWRGTEAGGADRMTELIRPLDLPASAVRRLDMPFRRFGCTTVEDWDDILDDVASVHLKYWDVDDTSGALTRQTSAVKAALVRHDYRGFVCSEWGGHDWLEPDEAPAVGMTRAHRAIFDSV